MRRLHHLCIQTDCYEKSLEFYCKVFDYKVIKESKDFHNRYYNTWIECDGLMIELQTNKKGEALIDYSGSNKGLVHFCYYVDDLDSEYNRMKAFGCQFKSKHGEDIYTVEGGRLLKVIAPEGAIIELRDNPEL